MPRILKDMSHSHNLPDRSSRCLRFKLSKREKNVYIVTNEYHSTLAPSYISSFLWMIAAHWLESSRLITIPT